MTTVFNVSLVFSSATEDDPQQSVLLSRCWTQLNVLICYVKDVLKHGKDPAKVWAIPEHFATSGTDVEVRDLQQKTRGYRVQLDGCPTRKGQSVWIQAWKRGPANLVSISGEVRGRTGGRHLLFHLVGRFGEVCVLVLEKASLFEHLDHVRSGHCHILITVTSLTAAEYVTGSELDVEVSEDSNGLVSGFLWAVQGETATLTNLRPQALVRLSTCEYDTAFTMC